MARRKKKKKGKKKQGGSNYRQEARSNSGGDVAAEIDETFHTPETNSATAAPPLEIPSARDGVDAKGGGGGKGKGAEEREETCLCCQIEFTVAGDGGVAFCCPTSHYMCNECCGIWVHYVMLDLDSRYPPKCPQFECRALITNETVERQLTSDQLNTFRAHAAARTVNSPLNLNNVQSNTLLTTNAIKTMFHMKGSKDNPSFKPTVQVIHVKNEKYFNVDTFTVVISDGQHSFKGMVDAKSNQLVHSGIISEHNIIRVNHFDVHVSGNKIINIYDANLVGQNPGHRIGKPVNINLAANAIPVRNTERAKLEQREKRNILTMQIVQAFDEVDEEQKNIALEAAAQRNEDPLKEWAPPTREECPICFLLLPIDEETETFYRGCCGKSICRGCVYVQLDTLLGAASEEIQEKVISPLSSCPFCRTELPKSDEECLERNKKLAESGHPEGLYRVGRYYLRESRYDNRASLSANGTTASKIMNNGMASLRLAADAGSGKALELLGEVFLSEADADRSHAITKGWRVGDHYFQALKCFQKAAELGRVHAFVMIGEIEMKRGKVQEALLNLRKAAICGMRNDSLFAALKRGFVDGYIKKDEYFPTLHRHMKAYDEMNSESRKRALNRSVPMVVGSAVAHAPVMMTQLSPQPQSTASQPSSDEADASLDPYQGRSHHNQNSIDDDDSQNEDGSQSGEYEEESHSRVVIMDCGVAEINGTYEKSGSYDCVPKYACTSRYNGRDEEFSIFRCRLTDNTRRWYISIVPMNSLPGTTKDIDFYASGVPGMDGFPPSEGWLTIGPTSGGRGMDPPPKVLPGDAFSLSDDEYEDNQQGYL